MHDKPVKILIVDDDLAISESLKDFLIEIDYDVYTAASANEAITLVDKIKPHVILTDLSLPDIYGEKLIEDIAGKYPEIKFIIHTGKFDYSPSDRLKELGISKINILPKPIKDMFELVNTIQAVIKK